MLWLVPALIVTWIAQGVAYTTVLDTSMTCPATVSVNNQDWATPDYDNDCIMSVTENPARGSNPTDVNLVVLNPYAGAIGPAQVQVDPILRAAAQEIEDSGLLTGYRLKLYLVDSRCSAQDGSAATIRVMNRSPTKHGILGDCCSGVCMAVNDAMQVYNVLQMSSNCIANDLSDRHRYPSFARFAPSFRANVNAGTEIIVFLQWKRVAVIYENRAICMGAADIFIAKIEADLASGSYEWVLLTSKKFSTPADAPRILDEVQRLDARIMWTALYEDEGAVMLCEAHSRGMFSPEWIWFTGAGWWNQNFLADRVGYVGTSVGSYVGGCTAEQMHDAGYGLVAFDRGPMLQTNDVHGLSGRVLKDIHDQYASECAAFAGGFGLCGFQWAGYFYDALWQWAYLFDQYLVQENRALSNLTTPAQRQWMYEKELTADFMGVTGRVRHFNSVDPVMDPPSHGDRDGTILLKALTGPLGSEFNDLAHWSQSEGFTWLTDILWSKSNPSQRVPCASGTCDFTAGWKPLDRSASCPAGTVYENTLGCKPCDAGKYGALGATSCTLCDVGRFNDVEGQEHCQECVKGTYGKQVGLIACADCVPGTFTGTPALSACERCAIGTYQELEGTSACVACTNPPGSTTPFLGSNSDVDCVCGAGSYLKLQDAASGTCVSCPEGMTCPVGADERNFQHASSADGTDGNAEKPYPVLQQMHWASRADPTSVFRCATNDHCPGGAPDSCGEHLEGQSCSLCADDYFWDGEACLKCTSVETSNVLFPVLPLVLAPILISMAYKVFGDDIIKWSSWQNTCTVVVFIVLAHYQAIDIIRNGNVVLPDEVRKSFQSWSFTNNIMPLFKADCAGYASFEKGLIIKALAPVFFGLLCLFTMGLSFIAAMVSGMPQLAMEKNRLFNVYMSVMFTFFSAISAISLMLFKCSSNPNDKYTLVANPGITCFDSDTWKAMLAVACVCIFVYCFGGGALYARVIHIAPKGTNFTSKGFRMRWKFLFIKYRNDVWWWALVFLARNIFLNLGFVIFASGVAQLFWAMTIIIIYTGMVVVFLPYRARIPNALEIASSISIIYSSAMLTWFALRENGKHDLKISRVIVAISYTPVMLGAALLAYFVTRGKVLAAQEAESLREQYNKVVTFAEKFVKFAKSDSAKGLAFFKQIGEWDRWFLTRATNVIMTELEGQKGKRIVSHGSSREDDVEAESPSTPPGKDNKAQIKPSRDAGSPGGKEQEVSQRLVVVGGHRNSGIAAADTGAVPTVDI